MAEEAPSADPYSEVLSEENLATFDEALEAVGRLAEISTALNELKAEDPKPISDVILVSALIDVGERFYSSYRRRLEELMPPRLAFSPLKSTGEIIDAIDTCPVTDRSLLLYRVIKGIFENADRQLSNDNLAEEELYQAGQIFSDTCSIGRVPYTVLGARELSRVTTIEMSEKELTGEEPKV